MTNERLEKFKQENGMSLEEAYEHVKNWNLAGKKDEAIAGAQEILKLFPDHEAKNLLAKLQSEKNNQKKNNSENILQKAGDILGNKITHTFNKINSNKEKNSQEQSQKTAFMPENKIIEDENERKIFAAQSQSTTNEERLFGALSYAWIFCLFPLLFKRESVFVQFHAKQGLIIFLFFEIFQFFIIGILSIIFGNFVRFISSILFFSILFLAAFKAYKGNWWKIPAVYNLAKKINF